MSKQAEAKRDGVINHKITISINLNTENVDALNYILFHCSPNFISEVEVPPRDRAIETEESVLFSCFVPSAVKVEWYKDGVILQDGFNNVKVSDCCTFILFTVYFTD